jgi:hypothetical protein
LHQEKSGNPSKQLKIFNCHRVHVATNCLDGVSLQSIDSFVLLKEHIFGERKIPPVDFARLWTNLLFKKNSA